MCLEREFLYNRSNVKNTHLIYFDLSQRSSSLYWQWSLFGKMFYNLQCDVICHNGSVIGTLFPIIFLRSWWWTFSKLLHVLFLYMQNMIYSKYLIRSEYTLALILESKLILILEKKSEIVFIVQLIINMDTTSVANNKKSPNRGASTSQTAAPDQSP